MATQVCTTASSSFRSLPPPQRPSPPEEQHPALSQPRGFDLTLGSAVAQEATRADGSAADQDHAPGESLAAAPGGTSSDGGREEEYQAWISGAVLFDANGLPQAYFVDRDRPMYAWEETVFKLLGLRWLLMSGLKLDRFDYARASSDSAMTFVLRRQNHFLALRLEGPVDRLSNRAFLSWLTRFEVSQLMGDRRFHSP